MFQELLHERQLQSVAVGADEEHQSDVLFVENGRLDVANILKVDQDMMHRGMLIHGGNGSSVTHVQIPSRRPLSWSAVQNHRG